MKKIFATLSLLLIFSLSVTAQNKQILYGFSNIPQTLLLNPGQDVGYKYHVGMPLLSGISADINMSGFTVADLFTSDNIDFNTKLNNVISNLGSNDYAYLNTQIEVINAGVKLNKRDYLSFGFYTEADAFLTIPKGILELAKEGNASFLNRSFLLSKISSKMDVLGVLHAGISRKINNKLTVGTRLKIYSSALNIYSGGNQGSFTTRLGRDNIYVHTLNNVDASVYSSGIYNEDDEIAIEGAGDVIGSTFLGGNLGLGVDFGFTYNINNQTKIMASLLDLGFISYSDNIRNATLNGNYVFSGIEFQYDNTNPDYWQNLTDDFNDKIQREENKESYTVARPVKLNAAIKHSFGKSRSEENCSDISYNNYYDNAVGAQLYSVLTPIGPRFAFTGFYERALLERLQAKVTYTVDDFSYTNVGIGISANIWKLNFYGVVDNVFKLSNVADANRASFQLGVNLIVK